jgi:hypothetical protein
MLVLACEKWLLNLQAWVGGVAEVVEHLPSKCEAVSSTPNTAKKILQAIS